jgi:hypothetical protein
VRRACIAVWTFVTHPGTWEYDAVPRQQGGINVKLAVELYSEKTFFIKEESYFKLSVRSRGLVAEDTIGTDCYKLSCMMMSGRRLGGAARGIIYDHTMFPAGLGRGEARPGAYIELDDKGLHDAAVIIETNLILDVGLLRNSVGLRLVNEDGKSFDIPLGRPDIEIAWNGRGRYVVPISEFVQSKLFSA